jgi:hypothetical protein
VSATDLGIKLSDLWSAEQCRWHVDFDGGAGTSDPWNVVLEWSDEHAGLHHADWVTSTWYFYGATVEEALSGAVEWCEGLLPFERCPGCDGEGDRWGGRACPDCGGSGLAHNDIGTRPEDLQVREMPR